MSNTNFQKRFREYIVKKKQFGIDGKERYEKNEELPMIQIIDNFFDWGIFKGYEKDTMTPYRNRMKRIHKDLNLLKKPLNQIIESNDGIDGVIELYEQYKEAQLEWSMDDSIPKKEKLSHNSIASLIKPLNTFYKDYLGIETFHVKHIAYKHANITPINIGDIEKLIDHIKNVWTTRIETSDNLQRRFEYKQHMELEIFVVKCAKYLWVRSKAISGNYLTIKDMKEMEQTHKLPLNIKKRLNNPKEYQKVRATNEFLKAWSQYKKYRASDDWSDSAPTIVLIKTGKPIHRRWIRNILCKRRREAGLSEGLTFHNIRRCAFTDAVINHKMPMKIAKYQLGDVSTKIVEEHYIKPDDTMIKNAFEDLYKNENIGNSEQTANSEKNLRISDSEVVLTEKEIARVQKNNFQEKKLSYKEDDMAYA